MRKLLGSLVIGLLILGAIGMARGWLSVASESDEGKSKIEISIDKEQLNEDTQRLKEGAKGITERFQSDSPPPSNDASSVIAPGVGSETNTAFENR